LTLPAFEVCWTSSSFPLHPCENAVQDRVAGAAIALPEVADPTPARGPRGCSDHRDFSWS